jgi:hypothetical protein
VHCRATYSRRLGPRHLLGDQQRELAHHDRTCCHLRGISIHLHLGRDLVNGQWLVVGWPKAMSFCSNAGLQVVPFHGERLHDFRISFDGDNDSLFVDTVAAASGCWQDLSSIGEW